MENSLAWSRFTHCMTETDECDVDSIMPMNVKPMGRRLTPVSMEKRMESITFNWLRVRNRNRGSRRLSRGWDTRNSLQYDGWQQHKGKEPDAQRVDMIIPCCLNGWAHFG